MVLHHTGKNVAKGARGWSGIRGRVDAELEIASPEDQSFKGGYLRVSKQRDMDFDPTAAQGFIIRSLPLGQDAKGKIITGAAVELMEREDKHAMTEAERAIYDIMRAHGEPISMSDLAEAADRKMPYLTKVLKTLIRKRYAYMLPGKTKLYATVWKDEDAEPIDPFS
jgi:hypothetical protein